MPRSARVQQRLELLAVGGVDRDAHARTDRHLRSAQHDRRAHGRGQLVGDPPGLLGGGRRVQAGERHEELVAARAGPAGRCGAAGPAGCGPPTAAARRRRRGRGASLTALKPFEVDEQQRQGVRARRGPTRSPSPPAPRAGAGWAGRSAGRCRRAPRSGRGTAWLRSRSCSRARSASTRAVTSCWTPMYWTTAPAASNTGARWISFHHGVRSGPRRLSTVSRHSSPRSMAARMRATAAGSVSGLCRKRQLRPSTSARGKPGELLERLVDVDQRLVGLPHVGDRHAARRRRQRAAQQGVAVQRRDRGRRPPPVAGRADLGGGGSRRPDPRGDPRQQRVRRADDGGAVVGQGVLEGALQVRSVVPEVAGEQGGAEVRAEDDDVPLAAHHVVGSQVGAAQARQRLDRQPLAERADEAGPLDEVAVALRRSRA